MSSFLSEKSSSIIMILLGIIALIFPMFSTEAIGFISGIIFIIFAASLIVFGIAELKLTKYFGLIYIIFGLLFLVCAYYLIFDPTFVSGLIGFLVYFSGIMFIVLGIMWLFAGPFGIIGLISVIYGMITILLGYYLKDPKILGLVIGIWLLLTGLISFFAEKNGGYINT